MPRVISKKAATRRWSKKDKRVPEGVSLGDVKPPFKCTTCSTDIVPGMKYYEWSFRFGGTYRACEQHYPKPSQLTQSLMSSVYAAQEDFDVDGIEVGDIEGITDAVNQVIEAATEVKDQYEEAAEAFGGAGENAERAESLDSWISDMESWESDLDSDPGEDAEEETPTITIYVLRHKQEDGTWVDHNKGEDGDWYETEADARADAEGFGWAEADFDIEEREVDDPDAEEPEDTTEARDEWWEGVKEAAQSVVDECPL